jgi:hypothetical protein
VVLPAEPKGGRTKAGGVALTGFLGRDIETAINAALPGVQLSSFSSIAFVLYRLFSA